MKTPISYYGGKQRMLHKILPLIPEHNLYCEPFFGGGAVFWAKALSNVEVINDTNREVVNFYRTVQNDFVSLEKEISITLYSRDLHRKARVIYNNPDMFSELKRAWAFWTLAAQSFSSIIDGPFGYDRKSDTMSKKVFGKKTAFTEECAIRLQRVCIECTDALHIIKNRDSEASFFYCDPPYYNADCRHYDGYTIEDFEMLLKTLSKIKGKFLLSSYPSPILKQYSEENGWKHIAIESEVVVNRTTGKPGKKKTEVLTANYDL